MSPSTSVSISMECSSLKDSQRLQNVSKSLYKLSIITGQTPKLLNLFQIPRRGHILRLLNLSGKGSIPVSDMRGPNIECAFSERYA